MESRIMKAFELLHEAYELLIQYQGTLIERISLELKSS